VNLDGSTTFTNAAVFLLFDPTKVQLDSSANAQAKGTIVTGSSNGILIKDTRPLADINASGEIRAAISDGDHNDGFVGNGSLMVFTFKAMTTGSTMITTVQKSLAHPFGMALVRKNSTTILPTITTPLTITIGGGSPPPPTLLSVGFIITRDGAGINGVMVRRTMIGMTNDSTTPALHTRSDGMTDDNGTDDPGNADNPRHFPGSDASNSQTFGFDTTLPPGIT
jgi:hypothetical protein